MEKHGGEVRAVASGLTGSAGSGEQTFKNILGYDGVLKTEGAPAPWVMRTYYAKVGTDTFPIAESFGYEHRDYTVDLNGDGMEELVANVQYGGDGHQTAYVYQRRGDEIWRGEMDLSALPNHDDWGANSTAVVFDPVNVVFRVSYSMKNTEKLGVMEYRGLSHMVFRRYRPA